MGELNNKRFLIVSYSKYPDGNAGAVRQHAIAKLLTECGYKVTIVGMGESTNFETLKFDNISYTSFRGSKKTLYDRLLDYCLYKRRLKQLLLANTFNNILFVGGPINVLKFIKKYSVKNSINIYHDSVEWYSAEEFKMGRLSRSYIKKQLLNKRWIDDRFKVISISKYLYNHFKSKDIETIILPVIMDVQKINYLIKESGPKIILLYAGHMGKKDYVKEMLEGLNLLDDNELEHIEFRIIGTTKEELYRNINLDNDTQMRLENVLICYGRIPRSEVLDHLEDADFTVLLRPSNLRYAKAGFPTKVVESFATATPVICNISSDLEKYLIEGENAIIVKECSSIEFSKSLKKAIHINKDKGKQMKIHARITAEKHFDYRMYVDSFSEWIDKQTK